MPIPDTPLSQPWCPCHSYYHILGLYDTIVGYAVDSEPELVDTKIIGERELAPGISEYSISRKSAHALKGLVQNSLIAQWNDSHIIAENNQAKVNKDKRNCQSYTLRKTESRCHPQDPIRIAAESINACFDSAVEMFREKHKIGNIRVESTNILRYEEGGHFVEHLDHHKNLPRVISVSMFLNDNFSGGELEFKNFNLKIKPEAGKIVVFHSGSPYLHGVNPVEIGIRYVAVRWCRLA
jgi:predicted 2-oxoglutarate/Fe(II)-dependent dioxygenase YbiX